MCEPRCTFKKSERIVLKKTIESLYQKGESLFVYPFKVRFIFSEVHSTVPTKVLISVPKKNFKKAVHRNRIKRLIRESYRLNKSILMLPDKSFLIHFHYISKTLLPFQEIQKAIIQILSQLSRIKT